MQKTSYEYPMAEGMAAQKPIEPSSAFKREVIKVVALICLFIFVYLLLVATAFLFAAACVYGGIVMIISMPKFIVLLLGLGIIGLGIMVFVFLVKFLFAMNRQDVTGYMELTEADQPRLFSFIGDISRDTGTRFPKHIYLSPEVNASVFYDSGFWSMFLPVRKNLVVGLGLVNALNRGEFRAVLAHEFGHFSQRSMKLGSFIYQVNRIIFNMLYDNRGYGTFLKKWADISGYFAFFAAVTVKVIGAIQWLLRKLYGLVNKGYMGLSREMEFHADAVAATVSGGNNLETALYRLELADSGYQSVLDTCNDWLRKNEVSQNFYPAQRMVMAELANKFNLPLKEGLPLVTSELAFDQVVTRVNYKDQWASHPPTTERIERLHELNLNSPPDHCSAWTLFQDEKEIQQSMTALVYSLASTGEDVQQLIPEEDFNRRYRETMQYYAFPEIFKGCYDGRPMSDIDLDQQIALNSAEEVLVSHIGKWCTTEQASLMKRINGAEQDIETLNAIDDGSLDTKSFDFEGLRYTKADIPALIGKVRKDIADWQARLQEFDEKMFRNSYWLAARIGSAGKLKESYQHYFTWRNRANDFYNHSNEMFERLNAIYTGESMAREQAEEVIAVLKDKDEPSFRQMLVLFLGEGIFAGNSDLAAKVENYLGADFTYFDGKVFISSELDTILAIGRQTWAALQGYIFNKYKELLHMQASLYPDNY